MKDPRWWFGFFLLLSIDGITILVAWRDVEESKSAGIKELTGTLCFALGMFCQWAYSHKRQESDNKEE